MLVREHIAKEIRQHGGWISFARYMELALHAPGLGYYASGSQKFGAGGDFVTAPELGSLFGRTLARQLKDLSCEYFILETSAALRERQRERLGSRVQFMERLPESWRGIVLANEVAD